MGIFWPANLRCSVVGSLAKPCPNQCVIDCYNAKVERNISNWGQWDYGNFLWQLAQGPQSSGFFHRSSFPSNFLTSKRSICACHCENEFDSFIEVFCLDNKKDMEMERYDNEADNVQSSSSQQPTNAPVSERLTTNC